MRAAFLFVLSITCSLLIAQTDFLPYQKIFSGSNPSVVRISDMNNDGLEDIVMGTQSYFDPLNDFRVFVFHQDTTGGLNLTTSMQYSGANNTSGYIFGMDVADINNDSLNDLIIVFGDSLGIFYQNAAGILSSMQTYYSGVRTDVVKAGDLNNDGLVDIAVAHWIDDNIKVFYQNPGGFSQQTYPKPNGGWGDIEIADINNDGLEDIVYTHAPANSQLYVFKQTVIGTLSPYVPVASNTSFSVRLNGVAVGDLNGDGLTDVAASKGGNRPDSWINLWFQDSLAITQSLGSSPTELNAYDIPKPIEIDDLNCDGEMEIIVGHSGWESVSVFERDSFGGYGSYLRFQVPFSSIVEPQSIAIGDINQDGLKDIAVSDRSGLFLLINNSTPPPSAFTVVSTTSTIDSIYFNIHSTQSIIGNLTIDTSGNYFVFRHDSLKITHTYREDSVRLDTQIVSEAQLCGQTYSDTVVQSTFEYYNNLIRADTTVLSVKYDTINAFSNIGIYPNPTTAVVFIELPSPLEGMSAEISIHDLSGALLHTESWRGRTNRRKLNFQSFADGVYLMKISVGNEVVVRRIVKDRKLF